MRRITYVAALLAVFAAFVAGIIPTYSGAYSPAGRTLLQSMNPDLALTLVLLGLIGIHGEFLRPGSIVPGITGAISVLCGLAALSRFPWNTPGALLLAAAVLLCVAEAWLGARGSLAVIAAYCMFAGIRTTLSEVHIATALVGSIALVAVTAPLLTIAFRARRNKSLTAAEATIS